MSNYDDARTVRYDNSSAINSGHSQYFNNETHGAEEDDNINFGEIFGKAFYHWPLYVLFFLISCVGAFLYLRYTKPVYSSSAKIYIKDEKKVGSQQLDALKDMAMFGGGSKLVENEMEMIKSPIILQDVIRDHQFNIRYFGKGHISEYEIYKDLPIKLNILSDSNNVGNFFFDITRKNNNNIQVKYFKEDKIEHIINTHFDQPFSADKDQFSISYIPAYNMNNLTGFQVRVDSILQLAYKKATELNTSLVNKQASVFDISYEDGVAKRAADFLNAIADRYNQYTLEDKNQTAYNTIKFIDVRLQSLGGELNILEKNVETFKKSRGITEIDESAKLFLEQAKDADQKLDEANIQLSVYNQIEKYVNNTEGTAPFTPILGNVDPALASLINRYQELQTEKKKLSLSLQPNNPIQQNLDQQITDARNIIQNYIAGYRRNALTARGGLQRSVNQIEGQIAQIPGFERQFINLKRQQGVKEALYLYLLQKKEESAVSYASNIVDNKIISPAYIPLKPVSPNKWTVAIVFIFGGIIITSAYLYLKYFLSNKVTSRKDIENVFHLPIVGEVYKDENELKQWHLNTEVRSVLSEQILNIRNNLKFGINKVEGTPVILFTSSISGEGKTFLSAHLAGALTYNHKKVVMLELDLRKPKLSKTFNVDNSSGITNYIIGLETIEQIIKKIPGTERLYLIPSGPIPPNPIELLESESIKHLFITLRERFDYIIIDTSPIGLVSDAKSLSPYVDYSMFVCRFDFTPKAKIKEVAGNMDRLFFKKAGIIFNGIDINSSYAHYGYGYNAYGYGYGNSVSNKVNPAHAFFKGLSKRLV